MCHQVFDYECLRSRQKVVYYSSRRKYSRRASGKRDRGYDLPLQSDVDRMRCHPPGTYSA